MLIERALRIFVLVGILILTGCAANQLPGFQNTYYSYNIPQFLVDQIKVELNKYGLPNVQIVRDNVGRIRLTGSYQNEDEVDRAFIIVQSIVGIKSTSPFYPENIREKRWEINARHAMEQHSKVNISKLAQPVKRAFIIGINTFIDGRLTPILGEDDARRVKQEAEKAGYTTTTLLGAEATKSNIEAAVTRMKKEIGPNDSLLIYVSSHGLLPVPSPQGGDARKMSIAAYDTGDLAIAGMGRDYRLKVHETSISDTKIQELAQIPTRQTRVIMDTCYSGEILKGIPDASSHYILEANGGLPERAGISLAAWTGPQYASKSIIYDDTTEATTVSKIKNNENSQISARSPGITNRYTIITATSDGEKSWGPDPKRGGTFSMTSGKELKGSYFTQAFFEYLNQYQGQLEPAFKAAKSFTYNKTREIPPENLRDGSKKAIQQIPRMVPFLLSGDQSRLYE
jgi:hypothetical protein